MRVDEYGVDNKGNVHFLKEKEGPDELYAVEKSSKGELVKKDLDGDGNTTTKGKDYITVSDGNLLPQLADETNVGEAVSGGWPISGPVGNTSNRSDAYNVFKFGAENSNVEWSYQRYTDGTAAVANANDNATTITGRHHENNRGKVVAADIHSHPNTTRDDLVPSGADQYRKRNFLRANPNAKVQLYIPKVSNPNGRMLDMVSNTWIEVPNY